MRTPGNICGCKCGAIKWCNYFPSMCGHYSGGSCAAGTAWWNGIQSTSAALSGTIEISITKGATTISRTISLAHNYHGGRIDQDWLPGTTPPLQSAPKLYGPWGDPSTLEDRWIYCHRYFVPSFRRDEHLHDSVSYPLAFLTDFNPAACCPGSACGDVPVGLALDTPEIDDIRAAVGNFEHDGFGSEAWLKLDDTNGLTILMPLSKILADLSAEPAAPGCNGSCDVEGDSWKVWRAARDGLHHSFSISWTDGVAWSLSIDIDLSTSCICALDPTKCPGVCHRSPAEWLGSVVDCILHFTATDPDCGEEYSLDLPFTIAISHCCLDCGETRLDPFLQQCDHSLYVSGRFPPLNCIVSATPADLPGEVVINNPGPGNPDHPECYGCVTVVPDPDVPGTPHAQVFSASMVGCPFGPETGCWGLDWQPDGIICLSGGGSFVFPEDAPEWCREHYSFILAVTGPVYFKWSSDDCDCAKATAVVYNNCGEVAGSLEIGAS